MPRLNPLLAGLFKVPRVVYELDGDRLFGHRFCLLTHRGRKTGLVRRTCIEVLRWDAANRSAVVLSGFGWRSDWLRNLESGGALELRCGGDRYVPDHRILPADEAIAVLADYERHNRLAWPIVRKVLTRLSGEAYDGTPAARARLAAKLPLVEFTGRPSLV